MTSGRYGIEAEDLLILAGVLLLPWAFGGVEIWAYRSAALLIVAGASVALVRRGAAGWGLAGKDNQWLLPAFLLAAWAVLQLVPLPAPVLRVVSPGAYAIHAQIFPGFPGPIAENAVGRLEALALERVPEARDVPLPDPGAPTGEGGLSCTSSWKALSLRPSATGERLFWYVALLLGFLVVRERITDPDRFRFYRGALLVGFAALALFGLIQDRTWNEKLYWVRSLGSQGNAYGPYVNGNHFVGVMELAVPSMVGYAWGRARLLGREAVRDAWVVLALAGATVCAVAALGSVSKAGAALIALALVALGVLGARTRRGRLMLSVVALASAGLAFFVVPHLELGDRIRVFTTQMSDSYSVDGRFAAWRSSLALIGDYPLTGSGFGTFRDAFSSYIPPGGHARWAQLHNDYLEVQSDGGVIASCLVLWLAWGYGRRLVRSLRSSREVPVGRLGLALALASLSAHAFVDFNHQIPANALLFVTVAALALGSEGQSPGEAA